MSILANVTSGISSSGIRMIIAGQEKIGKTTLASDAPGALLIPLEVGYAGVNVAKTPMIQTYPQVLQLVDEITALAQVGQFPYKTIIWDSATALERQIHDYVISIDPASQMSKKTATMETAHGGYGKAHSLSNNIFTHFLRKMDDLAVHAGINIIFTCHVFSSKVMDPTSGEYDCWDLLLHSPKNQKVYGKREIATQWADVIGFFYEPVFIIGANDKGGLVRATSQNKGRLLAVSRTPSYTAGNRYGMLGEIPIPKEQGWNHFAQHLYAASKIDAFKR